MEEVIAQNPFCALKAFLHKTPPFVKLICNVNMDILPIQHRIDFLFDGKRVNLEQSYDFYAYAMSFWFQKSFFCLRTINSLLFRVCPINWLESRHLVDYKSDVSSPQSLSELQFSPFGRFDGLKFASVLFFYAFSISGQNSFFSWVKLLKLNWEPLVLFYSELVPSTGMEWLQIRCVLTPFIVL